MYKQTSQLVIVATMLVLLVGCGGGTVEQVATGQPTPFPTLSSSPVAELTAIPTPESVIKDVEQEVQGSEQQSAEIEEDEKIFWNSSDVEGLP